MCVYRRFFQLQDRVDDIDLLLDHDLIAPVAYVRISRLLLFAKVVYWEQTTLFHFCFYVKAGGNRGSMRVRSDFDMLVRFGNDFKSCQHWEFNNWVELIRCA